MNLIHHALLAGVILLGLEASVVSAQTREKSCLDRCYDAEDACVVGCKSYDQYQRCESACEERTPPCLQVCEDADGKGAGKGTKAKSMEEQR